MSAVVWRMGEERTSKKARGFDDDGETARCDLTGKLSIE